MNRRFRLFGMMSIVIPCLIISLAYGQNKFKLKPGATGKLCLDCHSDFQEKLKNKFVHTPVKTEDCSECHNPHTSSHGKLLSEDPNKVCSKCHESVVPNTPRSIHQMVAEGRCVKCHDPHASSHRANLLKEGNALCFDCHKEMGTTLSKIKFKHNPVEKGCTGCHDPHASATSDALLKGEVASLCVSCHKADRPSFIKQHMNYPIANARCTSCHNPHGSNRGGILFDQVHMPVANKMCQQCHEAPNSSAPFKAKKPGFELCKGCHNDMVNSAFNKNRLHWPLADDVGCLNCHQPHASPEKKLLKEKNLALCGKCHADTLARQVKAAAKHPPVQEGNCGACHLPHSSDNAFLLNKGSMIDVCGTCHEWQKHTAHPIGPKILDSRNKNLVVTCETCHRAHGTEYKNMIVFPTVTELCVQCHIQLKR